MINWQGFSQNYRLWQRRCLYPLISVTTALTICLITPVTTKAIDLLPLLFQGVQVLNLSNMSDRQEFEFGQQMNQEIRQEVRISRNLQLNRYLEEIGRRLATNSDRPNLTYTFQIVEDPGVNAFATAGGFLYMNTGLLKAAENEGEVASVLAHEMGHIEGKHLIKQMRQQAITSGIASATGLDRSQAVGLGVELALNLPRSRKDELDADKRGLKTLTRAGYAPSAMVSFMQKLQGSSSVLTILSTHPGTDTRIRELQKQIKNLPSNTYQPSNRNNGLDKAAYQAKIRAFLQ
ncbi:M48 family metalloprotease [Cuspidothrix issatschenkoi LEGE 03284]|uniref:M48 family metallopeptidase n=1 Tax=Cuspidothrix issatschenkoi TaxID=230752 RepID=UPI0018825B34|nr:M48 family metalloprotease [Cuspidothrix issatschenkoi]MBE9232581.1 M48 family metalloprotease [Cuspidothrix issatschenkoi LEGE 03284]